MENHFRFQIKRGSEGFPPIDQKEKGKRMVKLEITENGEFSMTQSPTKDENVPITGFFVEFEITEN